MSRCRVQIHSVCVCVCVCAHRFPPEADRKYMVVYWDHGNGWLGYGADGKCSSTGSYADHDNCSVASLATLEAGARCLGILPAG
jgi:hypothetical protein